MEKEINVSLMAFYPTYRGLGFTLFEGATKPLDWGIKLAVEWSTTVGIKKADELLTYYRPDAVVLEAAPQHASRRSPSNQRIVAAIEKLAKAKGITVYRYSQQQVTDVFALFGSKTKYGIASTITHWLPEFGRLEPPLRKLWESEDRHISVFSAAALALTHYYLTD